MSADEQPRARAVVAALANEHARTLYAEFVLQHPEPGADLSPSRRQRALSALQAAGLIRRGDDGHFVADDAALREILAAAPVQRATGIERFFGRDGRIDRFPANHGERDRLLRYIAARALKPGEVVTERELGARLDAFTTDPAYLRRAMYDAGILERTPTGSEYALVDADAVDADAGGATAGAEATGPGQTPR